MPIEQQTLSIVTVKFGTDSAAILGHRLNDLGQNCGRPLCGSSKTYYSNIV